VVHAEAQTASALKHDGKIEISNREIQIASRQPLPVPARRAVTAETIAKALDGRKAGGCWMARCPAHDDREPSLSISDSRHGKLLVRCHAGCDQEHVIAALKSRGLWMENSPHRFTGSAPRVVADDQSDRDNAKRTEAALVLWQSATPAGGTLAENYLVSRGLYLPPPPTLRFHAGLKHPSGGIWPAMVALVTHGGDGKPVGIQRTFLARDGNGKAPVEPAKMMLGPCRGGAVRLGQPKDVLMVGEGIETCLAAMQASGHPAWAALSTSGLRALDLPGHVREVIVLADGDEPGEMAARAAALRWKRGGRRVRIARPPHGMDFNDLLVRRGLEEGAR
jgi:putative DNA primase/helicase